jgi:hypothetical protein
MLIDLVARPESGSASTPSLEALGSVVGESNAADMDASLDSDSALWGVGRTGDSAEGGADDADWLGSPSTALSNAWIDTREAVGEGEGRAAQCNIT